MRGASAPGVADFDRGAAGELTFSKGGSRPARRRTLQAKRSSRTLRASAKAGVTRSHEVTRRLTPEPLPVSALPAEVARQSQREVGRLRRVPAGSPEAAQARQLPELAVVAAGESVVAEDAALADVKDVLEA